MAKVIVIVIAMVIVMALTIVHATEGIHQKPSHKPTSCR